MRAKHDASEGVTHRPRIDRRSAKIDQERSHSSPTRIPRAEILLEKGRAYETSRKASREAKALKEIEECTFSPQILTTSRRGSNVHDSLYQQALKLSQERARRQKASLD